MLGSSKDKHQALIVLIKDPLYLHTYFNCWSVQVFIHVRVGGGKDQIFYTLRILEIHLKIILQIKLGLQLTVIVIVYFLDSSINPLVEKMSENSEKH